MLGRRVEAFGRPLCGRCRELPAAARACACLHKPNRVAVAWFRPYRHACFRRRSGVGVTAASEHAPPDRERAETYLRLLAETELRRALAMPEYKPPRERLPARMAAQFVHSRRMRRRRAVLDRHMRQQTLAATASSQSGHANQSGAARSIAALLRIRREELAKAARSIAAPPAAAVLKAGTRTGNQLGAASRQLRWQLWRRFRRLRRHLGHQSPSAEACLTRLETVAGVFAAVGAVTDQTEEEIVGGLRAALAARSRIGQDALLSYHGFGGHGLVSYSGFGGHPMRRMVGGTAAPSGPPRAIPVGASASGEIEGVPVRFYLGVLVFDHSGAALTVRARYPEKLDDDDRDVDPVYEALSEISAVDERGGTYHADFSGGGGAGEWEGRLHLNPAPPPGVRWLDMTLPGSSAVRVLLDATPTELRITTEQVTTSTTDRFLDAQTIKLLGGEAMYLDLPSDDDPDPDRDDGDLNDDGDGDRDLTRLFRVVSHLLAAGVLRTDSPSLRRLAAAAARLDTPLPDQLAAVEPADLPADWLSLLSRADAADGPTGAMPIAVVLPAVDGVQCVIVELVSDSESATMQVHARGSPEPRQPFSGRSDQVWWSARDDLGGGYLVGESGSSWGNGEADLDLAISPAINPQARVLDIILTGTTTQVTVSVPLDWQEGL